MGSRGASSGRKSNIIQFKPRQKNESTKGWTFPGNEETISKLSKALDKVNNGSNANRVYKGINELDRSITGQMKETTNTREKRTLMAQRRKVRQLKKKLLDKKIL